MADGLFSTIRSRWWPSALHFHSCGLSRALALYLAGPTHPSKQLGWVRWPPHACNLNVRCIDMHPYHTLTGVYTHNASHSILYLLPWNVIPFKEELFYFSVSATTWKVQYKFADKRMNEQIIPTQARELGKTSWTRGPERLTWIWQGRGGVAAFWDRVV